MTITLQPGDMDQIVGLLKPTTVKDAFGQHTEYAIVANAAAKVTPLRGGALFAAAQMQNPASLRVEIYWRIDVAANWRVRWMSHDYEITGSPIDVESRHDILELMCSGVPL